MTVTISAPISEVLRTNQCVNPSFEVSNEFLDADSGVSLTDTSTPALVHVGGYAARATMPASPAAPLGVWQQTLSVAPGQASGASFWVQPTTGDLPFSVRTEWINASDVVFSTVWAGAATVTNGTYALVSSGGISAPAGTVAVRHALVQGDLGVNSTASASFVTDAWSQYVGASVLDVNGYLAGDYFDGDSAAPGLDYAWSGTPGLSRSTEFIPAQEASPDLVIDYAYQREARTIIHTVLDRSDADVTLRPVGLRRGTLNMYCRTRTTATALEDLHRLSLPLTLDATEDEETASMVYVPTGTLDVSWDATFDRWLVAVGYQEVLP